MFGWTASAAARLEPLARAALSLGAAAIHFGVTTEHFADRATRVGTGTSFTVVVTLVLTITIATTLALFAAMPEG
jgi:hypothetical protein